MKMIVIGDNCLDIRISAKFELKKDKNIIPDYYSLTPGGTGINFAVAYSKLGGESYYFTPLSEDPFGAIFAQYLSENGVHISSRSSRKTAIIINIVREIGERTTLALIKESSYSDVSCDKFKRFSKGFDSVYISGGILTEEKSRVEIIKIVEYCHKSGINVFFDPQMRIGEEIEKFKETCLAILELSDIIFANEVEFAAIPDRIVKNKIDNKCLFVIKRGEKGAYAFSGGSEYESTGLKVEVKDTIGAGDIFNAAFLRKFLQDGNVETSLDFANRIAALSTTQIGFFVPLEDS